MTVNDRWLLPEGIDELLPEESARLEQLRRGLLDLFNGWGYELVETPFIEYLDSLLTGTGNDLELQTFKIIDQMTGRLMGVRADMTPQAARIDAHRLRRDAPARLCYMGTVLHSRGDGFAGSRSPFQVGAELYGHAGVESDIEVITLMVETLRRTGLGRLHLDLGHVGIYRGLVSAAQLDAAVESELFDALQRKALPEIEALLSEQEVPSGVRGMLVELARLNGGPEVLRRAGKVLDGAGEDVGRALGDLQSIAEGISARLPDVALHFDLGELRGYAYHTGPVYAVFVPGLGQAVAQGGRYDQIGRVFGRARPATGFSTDLKTLMMLVPAKVEDKRGIFAPWQAGPELERRIAELRAAGERVIRELPGQAGSVAEMGCNRRLVEREGHWQVVPAE